MSMETKLLSSLNLDADTLDGKHDGEVTAFDLNGNYRADDLNNISDSFGVSACCRLPATTANVPVISNWANSVVNVKLHDTSKIYAQMYFAYQKSPYFRTGVINSTNWTEWREFAFTDSNVASSQKLQDSSGVYLDRATWNALVARVAALENK